MTLPMTGKNCSLALKWLISFAIPLIVYWAMPIDGQTVTHHMALFLSITTWAICIWAMDAMNEIAVGLILPVLYIVLCGVKQQVVYSPWLSEVPLIVIGGFALGKILQETGLGKRIGLTCVRCMGGSFTGTLIGITLAVSIVAPLVPAITGKAAIFCAIGISLCDALDFKAKGREAMKTLSTIITYAMCVNVFFYLLEIFTAFYSGIPGHQHSILYLFTGHDGHMAWINSWMWTAVVFAVLSLLMLIPPALRYNDKILPWALILLVIASWIDKSLGLLIGGFVPNMFETVTEYTPTIPEILVALGVYGLGGIIISVLWKIAMDVKKENGTFALKDN